MRIKHRPLTFPYDERLLLQRFAVSPVRHSRCRLHLIRTRYSHCPAPDLTLRNHLDVLRWADLLRRPWPDASPATPSTPQCLQLACHPLAAHQHLKFRLLLTTGCRWPQYFTQYDVKRDGPLPSSCACASVFATSTVVRSREAETMLMLFNTS